MINLFTTHIDSLSVHQVGNRSKGETLFISENPYQLNDEITVLLKEYFLKPFREKEENYFHFIHDTDLEFHPLYTIACEIFDNENSIHENSKKIAALLYEQANHPHIKSGELYVTLLHDTILDGEKVSAIGIFKSEIKHHFLQFEEHSQQIDLLLQEGVNLQKLDKGCIIFNTQRDNGFKILSMDSNRYDTKYWINDFLGVDILTDENFLTKSYLKFCKDFAKDVILPAEDKQQEVLFMNRAINHFAQNSNFEESNFVNNVLDNPDLIPEFKHYKVERGPKYKIEDVSEFPIVNKAVSNIRRKVKSVIQLDTNIEIKMDFVNPETAEKFVEKGWDGERQMYYYLVYFNKEQKS